jgi:hypothetical protein
MYAQLTQYQMDNLTLLDVLMNTLSAAEKLVFGPYDGKKYGYYDEGNSSQWKSPHQLLKELLIQKECLQSMINLYEKNSHKKNFEFPNNLSKEEIIKDLLILREQAMKKFNNDYKIKSVYDDIIKLINSEKCERYSVKQIYANDNNKNYPTDEESVKNRARNILEAKEKAIKRDNEHEQNLMGNEGQISYEAKLYEYNGKYNGNSRIDDYYLNFYNNAYNDFK